MRQDTIRKVENSLLAGRFERPAAPEIVQSQRATRYPDNAIYFVYCAEDAPESDHIICLDYDGTDPFDWDLTTKTRGQVITGNGDGKVYRCKLTYTPIDDSTRPATGADWAKYWVVIKQIDVVCLINGGYNLEDASPHLLTVQKSAAWTIWKEDHPGETPPRWSAWTKRKFVADEIVTGDDDTAYYCLADYDATEDTEELTKPTSGANSATHWAVRVFAEDDMVIGTNRKEYYGCLVGHTGTADTQPCSGENWEDYWEVWKRGPCVLKVSLNDDKEWVALDTFNAAFEGGATNP